MKIKTPDCFVPRNDKNGQRHCEHAKQSGN